MSSVAMDVFTADSVVTVRWWLSLSNYALVALLLVYGYGRGEMRYKLPLSVVK